MADSDEEIIQALENVDLPDAMKARVEAEPNALEQANVSFNPAIHAATEHGDPIRTEEGAIKLRSDWQDNAKDRQGRPYNPKVHGKKLELDEDGYIKVRRRENVVVSGGTNRTKALVDRHREPGYAYYLSNDAVGKVEARVAADWEPVTENGQVVSMSVGRGPSEESGRGILLRKPQEWYDEDQRAKRERNNRALENEMSPKDGQYVPEEGTERNFLR